MKLLLQTRTALLLALGLGCNLVIAQTFAADVTIKRDTYGTPHVYANDVYGLFYGYGYAIAQDRLYQLEMSRRSTEGRVAEVLGKDYLSFDIGIRQQYSPANIKAQLAALPKSDRDILDGYAQGINAWLKKIDANPQQLMPKQFIDHNFKPAPWTDFDVAMVFIGSMVNRFGDYNTELENQQLLAGLIKKDGETQGKAIFNLLLSKDNPDAPTTIPKGEWQPSVRNGAYVSAPSAASALSPVALPSETTTNEKAPRWTPPKEKAFSNIIVLSSHKSDGAMSILLNGPQFGFYQPSYTYSIGLHGAGYDAVGNSPFGYPMVEFGYNRDISWGSTWGAGDNVDIYQLKLNPKNPEEYFYQGKYRLLEKRIETIAVKDSETQHLAVYRSVQGAVIDYNPKLGLAYAKRRGWEGEEVATLLAWNKVGKAKNHKQWLDQVQHSAINVNWYYADNKGNIGYALGGRYPIRLKGHDNRLPVPGDGSSEWQGFMPFSTNPQVYNPKTGYIANWNNRPAEGFPNPDEWWYSWNTADRIQTLFTRIDSQPRFTPTQLWNLLMDAAYEDPNARFFVPQLVKVASESNNPKLREAAAILGKWNYEERDLNADGYYDTPATPIFRAWLQHMLTLSLGGILPAEQAPWFLDPGYMTPGESTTGSQNISVGAKILYQGMTENHPTSGFDIFKGRDIDGLMIEALTLTLNDLEKSQGEKMSAWHTKVSNTTYQTKNFLNIPQAGSDEHIQNRLAMNRGTENDMVVFTDKGVTGVEVTPPGQSGFIAPDGKRSKHFDDQLSLFGDMKNKRTWLSSNDVQANTASQETISY
ncbi:penicillin acylase family protein [Serratia proteamaculans]|uniref:penicillin acylase family protein n=1 Tax=Serratia proteamaculans TaxID=28151 RepID=UPI002182C23D|nr:penicillin acylase family protein [Serratia proteamaculans]CAI2487996.1 Penicillin G acylase precursor [Serratia proteamaculans]